MVKRCSIRMGIIPGRLGGPRPSKYYQAQCGSELKNFKTKADAQRWIRVKKRRKR